MKDSVRRRADLQAAAKAFKKADTITLADLALLWGVSKPRFINIRNTIPDFPEPIGKQGNTDLYNAKAAVQGLLTYETRNDTVTAAKASKVRAILGAADPGEDDQALPPSEMLALSRARAEIEKRMVEQGELVRFIDVQHTIAQVFGHISNVVGKLSDSVDPNGALPGHVRQSLDGLGKELLLRIYADLNDMLAEDANSDARGTEAARVRPDKPRRAPPRQKRKSSGPKRAARNSTGGRGKH